MINGGGSAGLAPVGNSGAAGFALQNGTSTIFSWTAPNDGNVHTVELYSVKKIAVQEVGGAVAFHFTWPDGTPNSPGLYAGGQAAGLTTQVAFGYAGTVLVEPGSTISIQQSSALTGGASTLYYEVFAD
jgi:hypothetical protein